MITTVKINPVAYKMNSPQPNNLGVRLIDDNLKDAAILFWELISIVDAIGSNPGSITRVDRGNMSLDSSDYSQWNGNNTFPFTFVAGKLGLTIINE
jgi:hypothetical protein